MLSELCTEIQDNQGAIPAGEPGKGPGLEALWASGSKMARQVAALDWSKTPLGPMDRWPQSLSTAVRIILASRYPMFVWWGRELINIYNDAYAPMLGERHPAALGRSARDCWAEIWPVIGPQTEAVLNEGRSTWNEETLLVMSRSGYAEETYFTFSYSPAPNDEGGIGGVFCAVTEDTARVLGRRRLRTMRELGTQLLEAKNALQVCEITAAVLAGNPHDVPFALLYLVAPDREHVRLAGRSGIAPGLPASRLVAGIKASDNQVECWPFQDIPTQGLILNDLKRRFGDLPGNPWPEPCTSAMIFPIIQSDQNDPAAYLIAGISPMRQLDDDYRGFFGLVAGQVAAGISDAHAHEAQQRKVEALAELDRAKTAFFNNISHEFRTPLTLMLGPLEDLLGEPLTKPAREHVEMAHRNSIRLLKLVNTLLEFSRIEAARLEAVYEATDLSEMTADLASAFRSAIEKAGMRLVVDCPPLPEPVFVDRGMWERIVLNLLSNAFKFTFEGEIGVSLRWLESGVELIVRDTGTGIPAEEIPRIFDRFHRVVNSRSRSQEGTGIGLALVKELVRYHGGSISVSSVVGKGSAFTVSIPTNEVRLYQEQSTAKGARPADTTGARPYVEEALRWLPGSPRDEYVVEDPLPFSGNVAGIEGLQPDAGPGTVLLVDDNADMRCYLQRLLSQNWQVELAADGWSALVAAQNKPPDLVLADIMMPGLDGFGLLRHLRENPFTRDIPVILVSARAGEEAWVEGIEAGADDYLIKPFSARELVARVRSHLHLARLRRDSEHALRESEERLRLFIEHAPAALAMFDTQMRCLGASRRWIHDYGLEGRDIEKTSLREIFAENPERWRNINRALMGEVARAEEDLFHKADGLIQWVRWEVRPWNNARGQVAGVLVFSEDITERKRVEEALARLAAIVEWSDDAVVSKTLDGVIQSWNAGAQRIFGYRAEEVIGRSIRVLIPPERLDEEDRVLAQLRRGLSIRHYETVRLTKDGRRLHVSLTISPIKDSQGRIIGASKIARDIGDIVRAREVLARSKNELERLVEERTAKLQELVGELEHFSYTITHDMRAPLRAMRGYADLALKLFSDAPDGPKEFLRRIAVSAERMDTLITDALNYNRAVRQELALSPIDVNLLLRGMLDSYPEFHPSKAEIIFEGGVPRVMGNEAGLTQCFSNLLGNAVKFVNPGAQPKVRIWAELVPDAGAPAPRPMLLTYNAPCSPHWVRIWVEDNGIGIAPDMISKVFNMFSRGHTTYEGTGIGLALVRKVVDRMGGRVGVESQVGNGSRFWVELQFAG